MNKKSGTKFENHLSKMLSTAGFWVHTFEQTAIGQPVDIIAVRNGNAYLMDCKVCSNNRFTFSRIEENQLLSMSLWEKSNNTDALFAISFPEDEVYMLTLRSCLALLKDGKNSISRAEVKEKGQEFIVWIASH